MPGRDSGGGIDEEFPTLPFVALFCAGGNGGAPRNGGGFFREEFPFDGVIEFTPLTARTASPRVDALVLDNIRCIRRSPTAPTVALARVDARAAPVSTIVLADVFKRQSPPRALHRTDRAETRTKDSPPPTHRARRADARTGPVVVAVAHPIARIDV